MADAAAEEVVAGRTGDRDRHPEPSTGGREDARRAAHREFGIVDQSLLLAEGRLDVAAQHEVRVEVTDGEDVELASDQIRHPDADRPR